VTVVVSQYLSVAEFLNSPTGIDISTLVPGGTTQQNQAALTSVIRRASSWIDSYCNQILGATVNTEIKSTNLNREGFLRLIPKYLPIVQLTSLQYRLYPQADWNDIDLTTLQIYPDRIEAYNFFSYFGLFWPNLPMPYMPQPMGQPYQPYTTPTQASYIQSIPLITQYTYVNGYANTFLAADVTAGAQSITVIDPTGLLEGTVLTVSDGGNTEDIEVAAAPTGNTVSLSSPLLFDHSAQTGVSALPAAIKEACMILTTYIIGSRGRTSIKAAPTGPYTVTKGVEASAELQLAWDMLKNYRRLVVTGL